MARILPFKAWRYNEERISDIEKMTSPLFDVVNEQQLIELYSERYNSIHLSVPRQSQTLQSALETLDEWKKENIIKQDDIPALYVYYQTFRLPGQSESLTRKGFVCMIKAEDWDQPNSDILRHENTIPHSVEGRVKVLEATGLNVSPTHGLYQDVDHELEQFMDEAMSSPIYEVEDYQGVKDSLALIHDKDVITKFINKLKDQKVILADGHHRLESSIIYRKKQKHSNPKHQGDEGYNYHMMYLTNGASKDLRILPTHRLISGLHKFDKNDLLQKLSSYFNIKAIADPFDIEEIIRGKKWAFGLVIGEEIFRIQLIPEKIALLDWDFSDKVKELDLTVLHYFVIEKCLGISGKDQRTSEHISFERNFTLCVNKTSKGEAQCALITNELDMPTILNVCHSGDTLPQKSTFFYPKVVSGFIFGSIKDDEFRLPIDPSF